MSTDTPDTKRDAYQATKDSGDDVSLRRQVAAALADQPDTTAGLSDRFPEHSANAIRPRVNELLRMQCVERDGKRENVSGHEAYLHHLTKKGERYLDGEIDPEPGATVAQEAKHVVAVARQVATENAPVEQLTEAVRSHDETKASMDPEFESELLADENDMTELSELESPRVAIRQVVENADGHPTVAEVVETVVALTESDAESVRADLDALEGEGLVYLSGEEVKLP